MLLQGGHNPTGADPMKHSSPFFVAAALAISLAGMTTSTSTIASPITYNFAGKLTDSFGSLNVGDAFSGSYTLDPSVVAIGNSSQAVFNNLLGASLTIGSFSATIGPGTGLPEIQQDDNVTGADRYALVGRNPLGSSQIGGLNISLFGFRLDDTSETALSDATALLTNPSLSNFTSKTFLVFFGDPTTRDFAVVSGTLDSLSSIPEPATFALLGLGLVGLGFSRHRRA